MGQGARFGENPERDGKTRNWKQETEKFGGKNFWGSGPDRGCRAAEEKEEKIF